MFVVPERARSLRYRLRLPKQIQSLGILGEMTGRTGGPQTSAKRLAESPATLWGLLRTGGWPLLILLGMALALKLVVVATALSTDPLASYATSDSRYYVDRALGLLGRQDDPFSRQPYHLPPLYPYVLRVVPGFDEGTYGAVLVLQTLAGTAMLAGVYVLARRRMGAGGAIVATGATLLYGPLSFYETKLLGDSLATTLLVAVLVATDVLAQRPSHKQALLTSVVVAAVVLLRPQVLLLAFGLLIWIAVRARQLAASYAVGVVAVILPFTIHNWRASGDLILVSDNGGVNFWLANTGPISGTFETYDRRFFGITEQAQEAKRVADAEAGRSLSPGEVSDWLTRRALAEIVAHPRRFATRVTLRARALLESFETDVACFPPVESTTILPLRALLLPFGVLAGLALAAAVLGARLRAGPHVPMWLVATMVTATALLFFHYSRFRLPLAPLLALGVGAGWERVRAGGVPVRRWLSAALAFIAMVMISLSPAPHHANTLANGWTSLAEVRLARASPDDPASIEATLADVNRALTEQPGFARAELVGARASLLMRRYDAADAHLTSAEAALPDYPPVMFERARLAAFPDPANRHRDANRARRLLADLDAAAAGDPLRRAGIEEVRRWLAR
jgi:hypothetical protein